ncbi:hypothetical protein METBIDRAFT_40585 [Metschnikowia bicuspidata var. bicuspidata NRRL YB-4993]|uniref:SWR1-complex protein 4 n=1 Tax=Metschnikowia bicuspidata var. bicuspidata NRRL YB-4993 TaxID=869754 RepID=A0A1A0HDQ0_9ASCO|nr:hypothetical protein METBIDRAFT_40585 [Metschnikowia bicuspidata var. bicuspidata NRRL YB-4993]OBA22022.1 hypothetical protein METBIDRAFT_40585 [Metschnikowia bicuspidata var. bicuspidata NRRL YB-4993]
MSANDILDVLNIQRDDAQQPAKKRLKTEQPSLQKSGMARELYNLLGPNTPPVNINLGAKAGGRKQRVSPWTRMPFVPNKKRPWAPTFNHWEKGSRELLQAEGNDREYFFDKFLVAVDIPEMVDEPTFDNIMAEIMEQEQERRKQRANRASEKTRELAAKADKDGGRKHTAVLKPEHPLAANSRQTRESQQPGPDGPKASSDSIRQASSGSTKASSGCTKASSGSAEKASTDSPQKASSDSTQKSGLPNDPPKEAVVESPQKAGAGSHPATLEHGAAEDALDEWTYNETKMLFEFCKDFELKWHVINDRFPACFGRTMEDLKEQFYRVCAKILKYKGTGNPSLLESLDAFSKSAEIDRKQYLESLLKRTPAEIAEEESLVIEARRFELAAKKMLMERTNLLALMDSPQSSQSVQQYQSSQGLTNLYNNLMILDKHQKKKMQQKSINVPADPVPPPIPLAASSSHKRDRSFQTHLQQYLAGVLKLQPQQPKGEPNPIQQLLAKRLTTKEEEAYGLMYHANERLTPNVILRSTQKLSGLQQRQSVFKAVNNMFQELDIPTAGGTSWKPNMPTRKTMAKYDELVKSVVALLEVKKGKDKLEAEIELIKSQRGLQ